MKFNVKSRLVLALLMLGSFTFTYQQAHAQESVPAPTPPISLTEVGKSVVNNVKSFIAAEGTNSDWNASKSYFGDVYLTLPQSFDGFGGGLIGGKNISSNVAVFIGLDYLHRQGSDMFYMPSGNASLHGQIDPFAKYLHWSGHPIDLGVIAGAGVPIAGGGQANGSIVGIAGAYGKTHLGSTTVYNHKIPLHTGAGYTKWINAGKHDGNYLQLFIGGSF